MILIMKKSAWNQLKDISTHYFSKECLLLMTRSPRAVLNNKEKLNKNYYLLISAENIISHLSTFKHYCNRPIKKGTILSIKKLPTNIK